MVNEGSPSAAVASIMNDPSNYDWTTAENNPLKRKPGSASGINYSPTGAGNSSADTKMNDPQTKPSPSRVRATDKEVVDFMYSESANATMMRLSNEFVPIVQAGADTLVYIGIPPQTSDQSDYDYNFVKRQFERPYLMKSDTLLALDSKKFTDFLGPKSKRTQRKLQAAGIHKLVLNPEKLKYFVNLVPDIHDDEGLILLTELSVPAGARRWHQDAQRFDINTSHVCGRDQLDIPPKPQYRPLHPVEPDCSDDDEEDEEFAQGELMKNPKSQPDESRPNSKVLSPSDIAKYNQAEEDDYSQLRHYTGIARLLHAIAGNDPKLNSAPKAWTFCMLAKFFDCAHCPMVTRWIADWLIQSNNLNFIQVNPATSYRMAMTMEFIWLAKCSFSIMVGQKAFSDTAADVRQPNKASIVPGSRIVDGLDDDDINRVDHAASALVRRIQDTFNQLSSKALDWVKDQPLSGMDKLYQRKFDDKYRQLVLSSARESMECYTRRLLCSSLVVKNYAGWKLGTAFMPPTTAETHVDIPAPLRPLTLQFWENLRKEDFGVDFVDDSLNEQYWRQNLDMFVEEGLMTAEEAQIAYVSRDALTDLITRLNTIAFGSEEDDLPVNPKKRAKLSPHGLKHEDAERLVQRSPQSAEKARSYKKMASFSSELAILIEDPLSSKQLGGESDSDWEKGIDSKDEKMPDSDDEDWETVIGTLEMPSGAKTSTKVDSVQGLPFRSKRADGQYSFDGFTEGVTANAINTSAQIPLRPAAPVNKGTVDEYQGDLLIDATDAGYERFSAEHTSHQSVFQEQIDAAIGNGYNDSSGPAPPHSTRFPSPPAGYNGKIKPLTRQTSQYPSPHNARDNMPVVLTCILCDVQAYVISVANELLTPGFVTDNSCGFDVPLNEVGTLMSLTENEYKYLPLWAGGFDDGSGGVFDDGQEIMEAPDVADGGFRGGAMGIIPGVGSSMGGSHAGSEFEDVATEVGVSTVGKASRIATDGEDTVISMDE